MNTTLPRPASVTRQYHLRTALFMGGYVTVNLAAIAGAFDDLSAPGKWLFAAVVAAPVIGQIWALLAYMRDSDEFIRALMAKRFIAGTGLALAISSMWGLMELYADAPHVSSAMLFPLVCGTFGLVSPFIRSTNG